MKILKLNFEASPEGNVLYGENEDVRVVATIPYPFTTKEFLQMKENNEEPEIAEEYGYINMLEKIIKTLEMVNYNCDIIGFYPNYDDLEPIASIDEKIDMSVSFSDSDTEYAYELLESMEFIGTFGELLDSINENRPPESIHNIMNNIETEVIINIMNKKSQPEVKEKLESKILQSFKERKVESIKVHTNEENDYVEISVWLKKG